MGGFTGWIVNLLLPVLKGMIEGIVCDVITSMGKVGAGTASEENGLVSELIFDVNELILEPARPAIKHRTPTAMKR